MRQITQTIEMTFTVEVATPNCEPVKRWGVYAPDGLCLELFKSERQAVAAVKLGEFDAYIAEEMLKGNI